MSAECAYFPKKGKLVVINNAGGAQQTEITLADGRTTRNVALAPTASPSSTPDRRGDRFRHGPTARREAQGTRETEETGIAQKVTKTTKLPDSVFRSRVLSFVWQMSLRSVLRYLCDIEETRAAGPGRPGRDSGIS
ncbi:MAG: 1,3-beta-galactosyl-N-acetylhexosamine phosphorylase C-terminal domain-containing protein [Opitutaceae bacterium]